MYSQLTLLPFVQLNHEWVVFFLLQEVLFVPESPEARRYNNEYIIINIINYMYAILILIVH